MPSRNEDGEFQPEYDIDEYSDLYEQYESWIKTNAEEDSTKTRLKAGVRAWLAWCGDNGVEPLSAVEDDVRAYIQYLMGADYADTTITRRVSSVSKYYHGLNRDVSTDWIDENPCADINLREDYKIKNQSEYIRVLDRDGRSDVIALSPSKIEPLKEHVPGSNPATRTRNELIIRLLWQTACRAVELSRIRLDNIDWETRSIDIRSAKLNRTDHTDLWRRKIWWEPNLDLLMRRWVDSHREQLNSDATDEYLLIGVNNKSEKQIKKDGLDFQLSPSYISRVVKRAAHAAGLQEPLVRGEGGDVEQWLYTAHRLRHSRITYLANDANDGEGMDLNSLRMMAGHAKFDTTLSYVKNDWDTARQRFRTAVSGDETF